MTSLKQKVDLLTTFESRISETEYFKRWEGALKEEIKTVWKFRIDAREYVVEQTQKCGDMKKLLSITDRILYPERSLMRFSFQIRKFYPAKHSIYVASRETTFEKFRIQTYDHKTPKMYIIELIWSKNLVWIVTCTFRSII